MKKQRYEGGGGQRRTYVRDSSRLDSWKDDSRSSRLWRGCWWGGQTLYIWKLKSACWSYQSPYGSVTKH